jgi:hypothetical protein
VKLVPHRRAPGSPQAEQIPCSQLPDSPRLPLHAPSAAATAVWPEWVAGCPAHSSCAVSPPLPTPDAQTPAAQARWPPATAGRLAVTTALPPPPAMRILTGRQQWRVRRCSACRPRALLGKGSGAVVSPRPYQSYCSNSLGAAATLPKTMAVTYTGGWGGGHIL